MDYVIRWAKREEWDATMDMVWKTFLKYDGKDCSQEGIQSFRSFITDERLKQAFLEGRYQLLLALHGERIIGAGSLRAVNHLSLLFVDGEWHRKGVGRALVETLCDYLRNELGERYVSLQASPYALGFYKKLGFTQIKTQSDTPGIPVVPMEKVF